MIRFIYHFVVDKKIPTLASALAFMVLINGGSFLFLYIILSGFFQNSFNELLIDHITDGKLKDLIIYFFNHQNNLPYSIFLIVTSLYSSSSLYYHFMNIVELITHTHINISYSKRIFSILLTIAYLIIFNLITLFLTELIFFFNFFYQMLSVLLIFFTLFLTFYFIHSVALKDYHFKRVYKGILFSMLYSILFTMGFILYLKFFSNFKIVYGILSFFIVLFFYIYVLCIGLLLGVYINFKNINLKKMLKNKEWGGENL